MPVASHAASAPAARHLAAWAVAVLCALVLLATSCRKGPEAGPGDTPSPPDLSKCTRLEIRCTPSVLEAIVAGCEDNLLDSEETEYLQSLETVIVTRREHILALARAVALATYRETLPEAVSIGGQPVFHVSGYRGARQLTSFLVRGPSIQDEKRNLFRHDGLPGFPGFGFVMSETRPFHLRVKCGNQISLLRVAIERHMARTNQAVRPARWSDAIVHREPPEAFQCPSAGPGRCHYAMNPNCGVDSAPDVVLLFEAEAGWNQHGGPELFTFDNHDPKGGCVLLNDGTVKFIRTEEELHTLRWE